MLELILVSSCLTQRYISILYDTYALGHVCFDMTDILFVYPDTPNDLHNEQQQLHVTTAIFPDEQLYSKQYVQNNLP